MTSWAIIRARWRLRFGKPLTIVQTFTEESWPFTRISECWPAQWQAKKSRPSLRKLIVTWTLPREPRSWTICPASKGTGTRSQWQCEAPLPNNISKIRSKTRRNLINTSAYLSFMKHQIRIQSSNHLLSILEELNCWALHHSTWLK